MVKTRNQIIEEINSASFWNELMSKLNIRGVNYMRNKDDLKQIILLHLLELDEEILINMYNTNTYKFYIIRIILNQRNGQNTEFNRLHCWLDLALIEYLYDDNYHEKSNELKENREDKLNYIFSSLNTKTGNDYDDVAKQLFSIYYERKYVKKDKLTYTSFAKELGVSRNTINDLLVYAKQLLKDGYTITNN
jgi:hypothetical protein